MKYTFKNRYDYDLKKACEQYGFIASPHFWELNNDQFLNLWNGLGAQQGKLNFLIPDTVWFLDISLASLPHDVEFSIGNTRNDFHIANLHFLYNMNQIVWAHSSNALIRNLRMLRTHKYYLAVESEAGLIAFLQH